MGEEASATNLIQSQTPGQDLETSEESDRKISGESVEVLEDFDKDKIYNTYANRTRNAFLLVSAFICFLLPMTDTAYLPSLPNLQRDLDTTLFLVSFTFSIFTISMGIFPLIWGPFSDYFGRKMTLTISLCIYVAASIGIVFTPYIQLFLVLRIFQALGCSSFFVVGASIISDAFPPEDRGKAMGFFSVPLLFGPVLGPVIGGAISDRFNWPGVFVFLAVCGGIAIPSQLIILRETLPYFRFRNHLSKRFSKIENPYPKPAFMKPWTPFVFLKVPEVTLVAIITGISMGVMFNALANILPITLALDYGYNNLIVGLCFLPFGVGCIVGSITGGYATDKVALRLPFLEARLIPCLCAFAAVIPTAIIFGFLAATKSGGLAPLLVFSSLLGFCVCFATPGAISYPPFIQPESAGAIMGVTQFGQWTISGILVLIGQPIGEHVGYGWLMVIISLLTLIPLLPLSVIIKMKAPKRDYTFSEESASNQTPVVVVESTV